MRAKIIDGRAHAERLRRSVANSVSLLTSRRRITPGLALVLVGSNEQSKRYVQKKAEQAEAVGIACQNWAFNAAVTEREILGLIEQLNDDASIHGILIQRPLPDHIDGAKVVNAVDPEKDVDGLHDGNAARLAAGRPMFTPCTPLGCLILIRSVLRSLAGKHAVVIGRSELVGRPTSHLLLAHDCTVATLHSRGHKLPEHCRVADILVVAAGSPELVRGDWIKPGATVIDVGINRVEHDGKSRIVGDVCFSEASAAAGAITPVPGGVGPMTVGCLLANTVQAAHASIGLRAPDFAAETY